MLRAVARHAWDLRLILTPTPCDCRIPPCGGRGRPQPHFTPAPLVLFPWQKKWKPTRLRQEVASDPDVLVHSFSTARQAIPGVDADVGAFGGEFAAALFTGRRRSASVRRGVADRRCRTLIHWRHQGLAGGKPLPFLCFLCFLACPGAPTGSDHQGGRVAATSCTTPRRLRTPQHTRQSIEVFAIHG